MSNKNKNKNNDNNDDNATSEESGNTGNSGNTGGGTETSFRNTPQAKDDTLGSLSSGELNYDSLSFELDVLANDLGGNAKSLWSVDDGVNDSGAMDGYVAGDLLTQDFAGDTESGQAGAVLGVTASGMISYDASALEGELIGLALGETQTEEFIYAIRLANGTLSWANAGFTFTGINDDPTLAAGLLATDEDSVSPALEMANLGDDPDSDDDGGSLVYTITDTPKGIASISGTELFFDPNGELEYLPVTGSEDVVLGVRATDQHGASIDSTVTVTIQGVNDAPTLDAGAVDANEDGPDVTVDLSALGDDVDNDNDGGDLDYTLDNDPPEGAASISGTTLLFSSGADFQTLAQDETSEFDLEITASDKHGASASNLVSVTVTGVNDAPTVEDGTLNATEDGSGVNVDLRTLADDVDSDDDADTLTYALTSSAPAGGTAALTGSILSFSPDADFQSLAKGETESFGLDVTATDSYSVSTTGTVNVIVTGVNDAPTLDAGAVAASEDGPDVTVDLSALGNDIDSDNDGSNLNYALDNSPPEGAASISGATLTVSPGADFQKLAQDETSKFDLEITATDIHGANASNVVAVTVTGVNDAPTVETGALNATEDGSEVNVDLRSLADDIDSDDDADTLTYALTNSAPAGTATLTNSILSFTPDSDFQSLAKGETSDFALDVTATDSQSATTPGTVNVSVTGVNDAPTLAAGTLDASEDGSSVSLDLAPLGNDIDSDDDGSSLQYQLVGTPAAGSASISGTSLSFDPGSDFQSLAVGDTDTVVLDIKALDQYGAEATNQVTVTVTGVNDAPEAEDDTASVTVLPASAPTTQVNWVDWQSATGPGSWPNSLSNTVGNVTGVIDLGGGEIINVTYSGEYFFAQTSGGTDYYTTPPAQSGDPAPFGGVGTYTSSAVSNGPTGPDMIALGEANIARTLTFSEPVDNLFFAIVSMNNNGYVMDQDFEILSYGRGYWGIGGATKIDLGNEQYLIQSQAAGASNQTELHGVIGIDGAVETLTWTSQSEEFWNGFTVGTYGKASSATVSGNVLDNDFDIDGDDLAVQSVQGQAIVGNSVTLDLGSGATVRVNSDGTYLYDENGAFSSLAKDEEAIDTFTYTVSDGNGGTDTATVSVTVIGINSAPEANDDTVSVDEDVTTVIAAADLLANDTDADAGDSKTIVSVQDAANGSVSLLNNGDVEFTSAPDYNGPASFTYTMRDNVGVTSTATVTVTVDPVNDAPVIDGGDSTGAVTLEPGLAGFNVEQWTGVSGADYPSVLVSAWGNLELYASVIEPDYTVRTDIIDFTDDPAGFAGEIPGSSPWPAAAATGASGTEASINNNFFARITANILITEPDTYTFRTFNDDGVRLTVNNQEVINDPEEHGEQAFTGDISLTPGVYPLELYYYENGGEASLELSFSDSAGVFQLVNTNASSSGSLQFSDLDVSDAHTTNVNAIGSVLGTLTASVSTDTTGTGTGGVVDWEYQIANDAYQSLGAGETVLESFNVTVDDGNGGTASQQVDITITGGNDAPSASGDSASTQEDVPVTISVLANDTDPDANDTLSLVSVSDGGDGTVAISGNDVVYTPNANFNGNDSFSYTLQDSSGVTSSANVVVSVNPVPDIYTPVNLVKNGSFEAGFKNTTNAWNTTAVNRVDGWDAADGSVSIDLNAEDGRGQVSQFFPTIPGETYTVAFSLSKNPGGSFSETMSVGAPGFSQSFTYTGSNSNTDMQWVDRSFTFTASNSVSPIRFAGTDPAGSGDAYGPALDEVVAVRNQTVNGFDVGLGGDIIDLNSLLASVNAPNTPSAFIDGFLNFEASGGNTVVQIDPNGGGDSYLDVMTLVGVNLTPADTDNYVL